MKKGEKKKERKRETSAKYKRPNCYFCLWLVDYSVSIQANHRPGSWKSEEILDCFRLNQSYK